MWNLFLAGGWVMWPILGCSIIAMGIAAERLWSLRTPLVMPDGLAEKVKSLVLQGKAAGADLGQLRDNSPLGRILAAGLACHDQDWSVIKEAIEDTGRHVVHDMGRYLNTLGTIASIAPWLGLLGTVFGMIKMFGAISAVGVGDPMMLAGGISQALLTTASGLLLAIPTLTAYRYLRGHVDDLVVQMEQEALALMEIMRQRRKATRPTA